MHCPRCHRRCLVLYGGDRFFCRKCYRLHYQTQKEDLVDRAITRAGKVRTRLGCDEVIEWPFPPKPKGMHQKTYERLEAIDDYAQRLWYAKICVLLDKWGGVEGGWAVDPQS